MKKLILTGALLISTFALSQVKTHTVQPKETIYGISKLYNITQEELKNANPQLKNRMLQIGEVINIPTKNSVQEKENNLPQTKNLDAPKVQNYEDNDFQYINVEPKKTLYSLSKEYKVTQDQIKSLNPFIAERGLQAGDIIRIPKLKSNKPDEVATPTTPQGMHLVLSGETVYTIAKVYGVEMADIYALNRDIQTNGLKKGSYIKIPTKKTIKTPITKTTKSFEHIVEKNETIFSIVKKYNVSLEELIQANPELKNGLKAGSTLHIPIAKGAKLEEEPVLVETTKDNFADNEINIALVIPFFADNMSKNQGERQIAQDFYIGAQIALKEIIKTGKKINVEIIDSKNDQSELNEFLNSDKLNKVDAIVGPLFQDLVVYTAQRLQKTDIPIFSPIVNSKALEQHKNLYIATPKDEYAADIIIDEMANSYNGKQTIKILTTDDEMGIAQYIRSNFTKRFSGAKVVITQNPSDLNLVSHSKSLTDSNGDKKEVVSYDPIIAVLASENNTLGSQFVSTITQQDPDNIEGFSVFFVPVLDVFDTNNTKNINALKEIGFTYTATRMVNTFGAKEKEIIKKFNDEYCSVPTKYMSLGYDVMYDVLDRMDKSGKISEFDARRSETRLSSKFSYEKAPNGKAMINKELRTIRLKK